MNEKEVLKQIAEIVNLIKKTDETLITREADIKKTLAFDEVARLELLMMAERFFSVQFSDGEMDYLVNIGDMVDTIIDKKRMEGDISSYSLRG